MSKKLVPTVAKRIQKQLDSFPTGLSKSFDALKAAQAAHIAEYAAYEQEAEQLFKAVDGADLWTIRQYVLEHPPSPGAIGFLVLIARDHYKSELARDNAMKRIAAREPARKFVLDAWAKSAGDHKSKADFSRVIHPLLRKEYPEVEVTPRTIERDWLPKGNSAR